MITDTLIQLISTLLDRGFQLPIHVFAISQNNNVVAAKFEGNPPKEKTRVNVLLKHIEDPDWKIPIHFFFADSNGKSESIKIPAS